MANYFYGKNSIYEALRAGKKLGIIYLSRRRQWDQIIRDIIKMAKDLKIPVRQLDENFFPQEVKKLPHQGIVAEGAVINYVDIEEIYQGVKDKKFPVILLLENIQDPHNLGALLRSAEAFGVDGIILPKNRACGVNATVHRVSAGAVEHLKICRVSNLNQIIEELKKRNFWVMGLDMTGDKTIYEVDLKIPLAVVVGGEDVGISPLTRKKCDFLVRIPLKGKINSLNTSVAGAIFLFEAARFR